MKIEIPGIPVSQARMRHCVRGKFATTYDPKAKEKASIRNFLEEYRQKEEMKYPWISFIFYMPIPVSIPKRLKDLYQGEMLKHDKKPDVDNLIKLYLDCLDGIVIYGDQKVSLGGAIKIYSPIPRTEILISDTTNLIFPHELYNISLCALGHDKLSSHEKDFPHDFYTLEQKAYPQSHHT